MITVAAQSPGGAADMAEDPDDLGSESESESDDEGGDGSSVASSVSSDAKGKKTPAGSGTAAVRAGGAGGGAGAGATAVGQAGVDMAPKEWYSRYVTPVMRPLLKEMLTARPAAVPRFIVDYLTAQQPELKAPVGKQRRAALVLCAVLRWVDPHLWWCVACAACVDASGASVKLFRRSKYHPHVDVYAPGCDVVSLARGSGYRAMSGSR